MFGLQAPKLKQILSGLPFGGALADVLGDCDAELEHNGPVRLNDLRAPNMATLFRGTLKEALPAGGKVKIGDRVFINAGGLSGMSIPDGATIWAALDDEGEHVIIHWDLCEA